MAPACQAVFEAIERGGYEARAVGGAVRNALMGEPVHEVDLATTGRPEEVVRLARDAGLKPYETGLDHGTITVVAKGRPFEVTTLRRDVETFGRRAVVAFTTDWTEDAQRRDFTINALYCDRHGRIYDPAGGYPDILARRVRFIGDARERIREDYLRILRFFRFHARYGAGEHDPVGLDACIAEREGLRQLSVERIRYEMLRLLVAPGAVTAAEVMQRTGIAEIVLGRGPDVAFLDRVTAIEAALGREPDVLLRLAAMACASRDDATALAARWRLSNEQRGELEAAMVISPALAPSADLLAAKELRFELSRDAYERATILAWGRSGANAHDEAWRARLHEMTCWRVPEMPFKGADVVALGVPPGPKVGAILKQFRDWWIGADFPDDGTMLREKLEALAWPHLGCPRSG